MFLPWLPSQTWQEELGQVAKMMPQDAYCIPPVEVLATQLCTLYADVHGGDGCYDDKAHLEAGLIKSLLSKLKKHGSRDCRASDAGL